MKSNKHFFLAVISFLLIISGSYGVNFKFRFLDSAAVAQSVNDRTAEADRLIEQGNKQFEASQFQQALQSWEQSLAIYREIGNRKGVAVSLVFLGLAYDKVGDYRKAINLHQQSLKIAKEIGNRKIIAASLGFSRSCLP